MLHPAETLSGPQSTISHHHAADPQPLPTSCSIECPTHTVEATAPLVGAKASTPLATSSCLQLLPATTSLAAQAAAALHSPVEDDICLPADQDMEDVLEAYSIDDSDICSAPAPLAILRCKSTVPSKQDVAGSAAATCRAAPDDTEGPDTPASAEKPANIIIRYEATRHNV